MQVKGNLVENATCLCYIEERSATEGSLLGNKISPNQCIFPFVHHCTVQTEARILVCFYYLVYVEWEVLKIAMWRKNIYLCNCPNFSSIDKQLVASEGLHPNPLTTNCNTFEMTGRKQECC
jgi:hypothetical protein